VEFTDKLKKILHHWIHHEEEHLESYLKWAKEARAAGMIDVAGLIEDAADSAKDAVERFREAEHIL
jgi:rubrerythrin